MRFRNSLLFATAITASWMATRQLPGQAVADPALAIFEQNRNRSLVPDRPRNQAIIDVLTNGPKTSPIARAYYQINPAKSILIYDCDTEADHWCAQPELSFPNMLHAAGRAAKLKSAALDAMVKSWHVEAGNLGVGVTDDTHFHLVAITNRMDMAAQSSELWTGAEVHFAYGLVENAKMQNFFVILEFRLAPAGKAGFTSGEFRNLAASWNGLSKIADPVQYAIELKKTLSAGGIPLADGAAAGVESLRLRINREAGGPWQFFQLEFFTRGGTTFKPTALDELLKETDLFPDKQFFDLAQKQRSDVKPFKFYNEIRTDYTVSYNKTTLGMGTPQGVCGSDYEKARKLIAIQQCTGCHTAETNTKFTHLFDVDSGKPVPSGFLIGQNRNSATNIHPSLVDLYYPNDSVVWKVDVKYASFTGSGCTTRTDDKDLPVSTSRFHDVARRTLFLATLLATDDKGIGDALSRFSTLSIE